MANPNDCSIFLPDLIGCCSFEVECNTEYESVSVETVAWLSSHDIRYDESVEKYNLWSALTFPHASRARLREACDVWTLLFLADDIMDSAVVFGFAHREKRELFKNMNECLQPAGSFVPLTPFASALHDWWQRVLANATDGSQHRLIDTYQRSNEASLRQAIDREGPKVVPDLDTYIHARRDTSYGRVICSFVEYSLELNIPDECWSNETFKQLVDYTTDAAAWTNDIYSFNMEQSRGDYNLISVLRHIEPSLSVQEAMDKAGRMIVNRYTDFERVRRQLPSWGATIDAQIETYINGLASGIIANAVWSFETPRYFGDEREEVKRTRRVTLLANKEDEPVVDVPAQSDARHSIIGTNGSDIPHCETPRLGDTRSNSSLNGSDHAESQPESGKMEDILSPFNYLHAMSGKKIRSKLIVAFDSWFRVPREKLIVIDEIISMLHNASLLIDDIEDGSQRRRGEPAAHLVYGVPLTINAAELACFLAMQKALELDHPLVGRILIDHLIQLHKGQGCDIWWRDTHRCPSEDDYCRMVINKCGGIFLLIIDLLRLFSSVHLTDEVNKTADELCQCLGLLFQIRDDYCNLISADYAENKSFCDDLTEGKYSFPVIHALRTFPNDGRLHDILIQHTQRIDLKKQAIKLLHEFGSIKYTQDKCFELAKTSFQLIDKLHGNVYLKMIINQLMLAFDVSIRESSMKMVSS